MLIKCKMCGGDLHPAENATTCECEYCGSVQTIPKLDNERRLNLYDRANHFRRNNEYDKAMDIFEQILQDDRTDAEAYWSLVLCRYGIEYVEDPATKKRIPTVNRAQFTSVFADEDYQSALQYADVVQKNIYGEEAKAIDTIQKGILNISKKEKPFDVFICYKETDAEGKRTPDSVLANDLYHQLIREGFKVFFSRITLEDKLGQQYEPYIFAALNTAKVMVVLGTKPEYFNAVWVKNEWSRYLKLIKAGANKTLVPAYKDMDPYDLPEEFSHLQAQDMSKLGFMQDLIHGIKKLAGEEKPVVTQQVFAPVQPDAPMKANVQSLIGRAFMALEDGEWSKADDFCEQALNQDFQNARAYLGKLMAELKVRKESDLQYQSQPLDASGNYQKALRFADEKLKTALTGYNEAVKERIEQNRLQGLYNAAMQALRNARSVPEVEAVKRSLSAIAGYKDAAKGLKACEEKIESIYRSGYDTAQNLMKKQQYAQAANAFHALGDYRDCKSVARKCDELEAQRQTEIAAAKAEELKRESERIAREAAERAKMEQAAAEQKAREDEIRRRKAKAAAKRLRMIIPAVVIVIIAVIIVVTKVIVPKNQYNNAVQLMKAGQYGRAITAFANLGNYSDSANRVLQAQANMAFDYGQYETVGGIYATLPEQYQDHADDLAAMYNDAVTLMDNGSYDDAVAAFTKLGNYRDSKTMISEATYRKAGALANSGDLYSAMAAYREITDYKDSLLLHNQLIGDYYYKLGEYAKAWETYATLDEHYQTHNSDFADLYASAVTLRDNGFYDEAQNAFAALGTYSDAASQVTECTYLKAGVLAASGNYGDAVRLYDDLGDYKDSKNLAAQANADSLYTDGCYADAYLLYTALDESYRTHAADIEGMYAKAQALFAAGDYDDAATAFDELSGYSDAASMVTECTYRKAGSLTANGQYDEAIALYVELNTYSDSANLAKQAEADQLYDAGSYADAYAIYAALGDAYQTHAADYAAMYANAVSLHAAGNYDDAIALYGSLGDYSDSKNLAVKAEADKLYDAGSYADAYTIYASLGEAYHTHAADYAAMYTAAETALASGDYDGAYDQFIVLGSYSDAKDKAAQCGTDKANALYAAEKYGESAEVYAFIGDTEKATECTYKYAGQLAAQGEYLQAAQQYETIMFYEDSQEQHYQMGLQARVNGKLADAYTILSADPNYRDAKEAIYQTGVSASAEKLYAVSVPAFTQVGAYKDAAMKLTMDTYAWGSQLFDNADYDKSAEVFASMGEFSDAPTRANEARYAAAGVAMANGAYDDAAARYTALKKYSDSADKANAAAYAAAKEQLDAGNYTAAKIRFKKLGSYSNSADMVKECNYRPAIALFNAGNYTEAKAAFVALHGYSDSASMAKECAYIPAKALYEAKQYSDALNAFKGIAGYKDSDTIMNDCRYQIGKDQMARGSYETAVTWFDAAGSYSDSKTQAAECRRLIALANAQTYEANSDYENAYTQYELAGEIAKMQETAYQTALVKLSASDYVTAIAWYEKAGTYSDAKEQILSVGEYYYATQQYDLAEAVYVKVLGTGIAAQRLYEMGQYYELVGDIECAAKCYSEAGEYSDAPDKAIALTYQVAESLYLAQDWKGAKTLYAEIVGYKDADSKIAACDNEIAAAAARRAELTTVGNTIMFGAYEQDNNKSNGKEAIEWIILDVSGNNVFVISKYTLDTQPYNTSRASVTWEKCSLRTWLNDTFLNTAFSTKEQAAILTVNVDNSKGQGYNGYYTNGGNNTQDKIFLLSYAEAWKYFESNNARSANATPYAKAQRKESNRWWLRSPSSSQSGAVLVNDNGSLAGLDVKFYRGVRPALWISLESEIFQSYIKNGVWE